MLRDEMAMLWHKGAHDGAQDGPWCRDEMPLVGQKMGQAEA